MRAALLIAVLLPLAAAAEPKEAKPEDSHFAAGLKLGLIPPVFGTVELTGRPMDHVVLGAFGIWMPTGVGSGANRLTLGGELMLEIFAGGKSTPYAQGSYFYYHAWPNDRGFWETSHAVSLTGGYEWKLRPVELQVGAGVQYLLLDEHPACTGFCINLDFKWLPALDVAVRYRF